MATITDSWAEDGKWIRLTLSPRGIEDLAVESGGKVRRPRATEACLILAKRLEYFLLVQADREAVARRAVAAEREAVVRYLRAAAAANYRAGDRNAWNAIALLTEEIGRGLHATLQEAQGPSADTSAATKEEP